MKVNMLFVCLLIIGKSLESSSLVCFNKDEHGLFFRIDCCEEAIKAREAVCSEIHEPTNGWTDNEYEHDLLKIRDQAKSVLSDTKKQRRLLSVLQNNCNRDLMNQLNESLTRTVVSFLYTRQCLESAQKARDARFNVSR